MSAILAGIGIAVTAYSAISSSRAQAKALRKQALLDLENQAEITRRRKVRAKILQSQGLEFQAKQATAIQKKGISGGVTSLLLLEETSDRIKEQLIMNEKETQFDQSISRLNAENLFGRARDVQMAGIIGGLGTTAFGAAQVNRNSPG